MAQKVCNEKNLWYFPAEDLKMTLTTHEHDQFEYSSHQPLNWAV